MQPGAIFIELDLDKSEFALCIYYSLLVCFFVFPLGFYAAYLSLKSSAE